MEYEDEGTSTGTKEQEHKTLEQEATDGYPSEFHETQDPGRQSDGTLQRFLAWAGVRPTLQATYEGRDGLLWWRDLAHCQDGDLSLAVTQANNLLEDHCCVESGLPIGTVIGVLDGHGGPEAAQFACGNLLPNLRGETQDATIFTLAA
jgi:pyruvate dehydrogenase phosphatase